MSRWVRLAAMLLAVPTVAAVPAPRASAGVTGYDWSVVAVSPLPPTMHPGAVATVTVSLQNTGSATWYADDADGEGPAGTPVVRLGATSPRDRSSAFASQDATWLWSNGRRIRMETSIVPPGAVGVFAFTFRAPELPSYPQTFTERFAPIVGDDGWLDTPNQIALMPVTVRPASGAVPPIPRAPDMPRPEPIPTVTPPDPATIVPSVDPSTLAPTPSPVPTEVVPDPSTLIPQPSYAPGYAWTPLLIPPVPATMHPGEKLVLTIVLQNTGTLPWFGDNFNDTPMRLAAVNAKGVLPRERASEFGRDDPTWLWSGGRRVRMDSTEVDSGGVGVFAFTFTAPSPPAPKTYTESFAPIVEGVTAPLDSAGVIAFTTQVRPVVGAVPPIPDAGSMASPSPNPTVTPPVAPSELPTPSETPTLPVPSETPTLPVPTNLPTPSELPTALPSVTPPPQPGAQCPTTVQPAAKDLYPPAVAAGYSRSGTLLAGQVSSPQAIAYGFGKLFVADAAHDRIVRTDLAGFAVDSFGSSGSGGGQMRWPGGVSVSSGGNIYVADTGNNRIQVWGAAENYLTSFGSTGTGPGQFNAPRGVQVIPNGSFAGALAIADTGNDRIQIVSRTTLQVLRIIGTPGTGDGQLSSPAGVSVFGDDVYVADTGNQRIVKFSVDGVYEGTWGGEGTDGGCTLLPVGIAASEYGVFVAEEGGARVEHFTRWGQLLETLGGLQQPTGVALDASAKLYVTDAAVARFSPAASAEPPIVCNQSDPMNCA